MLEEDVKLLPLDSLKNRQHKNGCKFKRCCKVSRRNGKVVYKRCENIRGSCPVKEKKKIQKKPKLENAIFTHVAHFIIITEKEFGLKIKDHVKLINSVEI